MVRHSYFDTPAIDFFPERRGRSYLIRKSGPIKLGYKLWHAVVPGKAIVLLVQHEIIKQLHYHRDDLLLSCTLLREAPIQTPRIPTRQNAFPATHR